MKKVLDLFRIRREERVLAGVALLGFAVLNALMIYKYYGVFTPIHDRYWNLFVSKFCVSGFDPITYDVVSHWEARYNVYRHPLLAFWMYLPYLLNRACMAVTGINCVQFVVAGLLLFFAVYSVLFLYRILREVVELGQREAVLLTALLFSFAHILLACMVPDHFVLSLFALLLALYVSGMLIKRGRPLGLFPTIGLFLLTGGISLNNGLKVFLSGWWVNGKRFFHGRYLIFAVIVPSLLLWIFCRFEYRYLVWPQETARHAALARQTARHATEEKQRTLDSTAARSLAQAGDKGIRKGVETTSSAPSKSKPHRVRQGTPISSGEFMRWTDISTSRWQSLVENFFGESVQLHRDHLLQDEFRNRPMIVHYRSVVNYGVEALLVVLFLGGIWCGRRSRFLWLAMSWFGLDLILHVGLGFGLNEVYIMACHWAYVIPIALGYGMKALEGYPKWLRFSFGGLIGLMTLGLFLYNGSLIVGYMLK